MSRVTRKEWYERVNATWPATLPALTDVEAIRAARKLYRFALKRTFEGRVRVTSGKRYTAIRRGVMYVNPNGHARGTRRGWVALVHDLSHHFDYRLRTDGKHDGSHARLEIRMIKEVIRRGWLDGSLRTVERAKRAPVAAPQPRQDVRMVRYERILARATVWQRKLKRAETALKKLNRQARYYERTIGPNVTVGQFDTVH